MEQSLPEAAFAASQNEGPYQAKSGMNKKGDGAKLHPPSLCQ
jgi:hypothetical protein